MFEELVNFFNGANIEKKYLKFKYYCSCHYWYINANTLKTITKTLNYLKQ